MRKALTVFVALTAGLGPALGGCSTVTRFREGRDVSAAKAEAKPKDCSKGGLGCAPADRRQYYDQRAVRYYYFDPQTGRYYWENGDPRF